MICEVCVIKVSKSFCFSREEKSSYLNEERLQLAELVEQFKKENLKEKETLEGKTRYEKKCKKHVPVATHGNFVAKAARKFCSNLSDKPNDDPKFRVVHSLATRCLANIDKLSDPSISQPKKVRAAGAGRKLKAPEVRQELFVWFVDIREALKGRLPKRLFKMKAKEIYAKWLEQNETSVEEQLKFGDEWVK